MFLRRNLVLTDIARGNAKKLIERKKAYFFLFSFGYFGTDFINDNLYVDSK